MTPMTNKKSIPLLGQVLQSISQRNQKTRHTRSCEKIPQFGAVTNNTSSVMINYQAGNTICLYVRPAGGDHKTKFRNNSSSFKNKNAVIPEMIKKKKDLQRKHKLFAYVWIEEHLCILPCVSTAYKPHVFQIMLLYIGYPLYKHIPKVPHPTPS